MLPWILSYKPKTEKDIIGQKNALIQLKDFLQNYNKAKRKSCLVFGPTGCGKTSSVIALANDLGYEVVEINASDTRNKEQIHERIGSAMRQRSLFASAKVILVDEIDGLSGHQDRGGAAELASLMQQSSFPFVLTANDPFDQKLSAIRQKSLMIEFMPLSTSEIAEGLNKICRLESISMNDHDLKMLSRRSAGDLRAALNDLQIISAAGLSISSVDIDSLSDRIRTESAEQALVKVFKTTDALIAKNALDNIDCDLDELMLWIDENLPKEYTNPNDLAKAYEMLGKADLFRGRIRRWQHWHFLVYVSALMSAGVAVSKKEKYRTVISYTPTTRLLKLWQANMKVQKRKAIAEKMAEKCHTSRKRIIKDVLPYVQDMCRKNASVASQMESFFELSGDELGWLLK